jgi:excinuclease ABC subunit B
MTRLTLKSNFSPTGDQPRAIEELVSGLNQQQKNQVLLGVTGSGKSLDGREPILLYEETSQGIVAKHYTIGDFVNGCFPKEATSGSEVVSIGGYLAPSFDPKTGKVRLSAVSSVSRHKPESLYLLETECGRKAILTGDHNLYVKRGEAFCLIETKDATPQDLLPLPASLPSQTQALEGVDGWTLSRSFVKLLGIYIQAGGIKPTQQHELLFSIRDDELENTFMAICRELSLGVKRQQGLALLVQHQSLPAVFSAWVGETPYTKRLPAFWAQLSDEQLGWLLGGIFDRPGAVRLDTKCVEFTASSEALAFDLALALLRLGIFARLHCAHAHHDPKRSSYQVRIEDAGDLKRFSQKVGFFTMRRREALAGLVTKLVAPEETSALRYTKIKAVTPVPLSEGTPSVYDLTVPGDETFLAGRGGLFVHNTFTIANVIERVQRPALIIAHNKTLAAQLYGEFKELFPENAVHYFVSYYDYYQPEAYVPSSDTYIEKDSQINEEIDRMRHAATSALLSRPDVIIVASVSCIYGLGDPVAYAASRLFLEVGKAIDRQVLLRKLVDMQYERNDIDFHRGTFRVRGDVVELFPSNEEDKALKIELFGDDIEKLTWIDPLRGKALSAITNITIHPNSHFVTLTEELKKAMAAIRVELQERLTLLRLQSKLLEAQRLEERTMYDLEMMEQMGYCNGIENYSRHLTGHAAGDPPPTLLDYFPKDFLLFLDESHVTVPQLGAMYRGDRSRKETLVEYGFRLPSALDNRPLKFEEFLERYQEGVFVSATPGNWEIEQTKGVVVEQIIRPTGLLDPELLIRPANNQIDDLLEEIHKRIAKKERVLITTLTKRMAEDLTEYYTDVGLKVRYMHADVQTLDRTAILRALRKGEFDVLIGINLLREGLDLPEVSLVAILDADKEGFLRAERSLIQTFGRAARNLNGTVIMYADSITGSMRKAIDETNRRKKIQADYNTANNITPRSVVRSISELEPGDAEADYMLTPDLPPERDAQSEDLEAAVERMQREMLKAAEDLDFEKAAELRDKIRSLQAMGLGLRPAAGAAAAAENPAWVNPWAHAKKKRQAQRLGQRDRMKVQKRK